LSPIKQVRRKGQALGHADSNLEAGVAMVAVLNIALFLWC
jgi:hypothetical protein